MHSLVRVALPNWHHEMRRHVEAMLGHGERSNRSTSDAHDHGPWVRGGVIGFVAMLILFGLAAMFGGGPEHAFAEGAGVLAAAVLLGAVPGSVAVVLYSTIVRWHHTPRRPEVTVEELQHKIQHVKDRMRRPDDAWQRLFARCDRAARAAGDAVAIAPPSSATDWLWSLHERMRDELDNVDALTRLARTEFPDERGTFSTAALAHPLFERLSRAAVDFESSRTGIVDIVARLVHRPDLDGVRAELSMLEAQLPVLSEPDPGT